MKEDEIARKVAETLQVAETVAPVAVPPGLKARVMSGIAPVAPPVMRPQWLRPALSVAAAVLVLTVNLLTIRHFLSARSDRSALVAPMDQIQAEYSQYNADF